MTNITDRYFNVQFLDSVVLLDLNYLIFLENETYDHKENLISLIDEIAADKAVKVLIINNDHPDFSLQRFKEKWGHFSQSTDWESNILRVFRTYNELFLKLKSLKKTVVSVLKKTVNVMILNFSMVADLRVVHEQFYVTNDNEFMLNIPKGGAIYNESKLSFRNPIKLLFLYDSISSGALYRRQLVDIVCTGPMMDEVMAIAERLQQFDYIEFEAVKILEQKKMDTFEQALQQENEFLLSCIRTKINQEQKDENND
ncbi:hypothetical protein [Mangrovibacterium diazotrophicum]|uniref:Enoyl-CoA hydratase/carnithine racemase n=1 Tax=Mangrovibacterium diazotrophicum TaxID=1261403 RepID=A0A419W4H7_9BACT|nr:hypothetical protein [Mangrovibacterium diazotrophicum]RKD90358.1 enoyl-CoA hydratase/carnithine racemase [Mangrovibacterium diazotrophicum]